MDKINEELAVLEACVANLDDQQEQTAFLRRAVADLKEEVISAQRLYQRTACEYRFLKAAMDHLPNPVFIKNADGRFVSFNNQYKRYFNIEGREYLNKTVLELPYLSTSERQRYQQEDLELIATGGVKHYTTQFKRPDASTGYSLYWSKGFATEDGETRGLVGVIVDITEQERMKDEIRQSADDLAKANEKIAVLMKQDALTGLYNRHALDELVAQLDKTPETLRPQVSVLLADLDWFKTINDRFGHCHGDLVLKAFANILKTACRGEDMLVRYGGEEFLIVLFDTDVNIASIIAQRIRRRVEQEIQLPDGSYVTVCLGVSGLLPTETFQECMVRIDTALYYGKEHGRNQVTVG